jgi:hypothetical protein
MIAMKREVAAKAKCSGTFVRADGRFSVERMSS